MSSRFFKLIEMIPEEFNDHLGVIAKDPGGVDMMDALAVARLFAIALQKLKAEFEATDERPRPINKGHGCHCHECSFESMRK